MAVAKKVESQSPATSRVDKWVEQYILIRDKLKALEAEHDAKRAPFVEMQNLLSARMIEFLDQTGQTSAKTLHGTVIASVRHTASLADPEAFMEFVTRTQSFELLDRRANATAVKDYVQEHNALPPGCNLSQYKTVGVQRPRG